MSLVPVAVGHAREHYGIKYNIAVGKNSAGGQGWTHEFHFKAYNNQVSNTVPLCVGNTSSDWRHLVKWGIDASGNGWNHTACCYVHPQYQPGTQPFTVSHAEPQWRWRISRGNGLSPGEVRGGWQQDFVFWAVDPEAPRADTGFGYFHIVSYLNGLCIELNPNTKELHMASRKAFNDRAGDAALWKWEGKCLVNKNGLAMDLEASRNKAGTRVLGWSLHGQINQQWRMEGKHIGCQGNNLVLDIMDNNRNPGAKVIVWTMNRPSSPNQMWKLEYH